MLTEKIYYADENIQAIIESEFICIENDQWYKLYQNNADKCFWRLDVKEKYNEQFFARIDSVENWREFDDKELRIELLKTTRGSSDSTCIWAQCSRQALNGLVYCEKHAYEEMGIRK